MSTSISVPFSQASTLIRKAFPTAKSRKPVKIEGRNKYSVNDYWDGGSRNHCVFLDLSTMNVLSSESVPVEQRQKAANPYNLPIYTVALTPRIIVVENCIFCGKDLGYRIYCHPSLLGELSLDSGKEVSFRLLEDKVTGETE